MALQDEIGVHWRAVTVSKGVRKNRTSFAALRRASFSPGGVSASSLDRCCLGGLQSIGLLGMTGRGGGGHH